MTQVQALGCDFSNFAGELSPAQVQGLQASGIRFAIVGYQEHDLFEQQVRALAGAGIKVGAYFFIYWSRIATEGQRLSRVLAHMHDIEASGILFGWPRPDGTDMPKLWLDFEDDTTGSPVHLAPGGTLLYADNLVKQIQDSGFSVGLYTGEYWWKEHAANDTRFDSLPLWHASQFEETVPVPFAQYYAGHEYGGWPVPMCWQFRGTGDVGGVSVDQDYEEWTAPVPSSHAVVIVQEADGRQRVFIEQD